MANIDTLHWPALISRKIRVTEHFLSRNRNNFLKIILFYFFFTFPVKNLTTTIISPPDKVEEEIN